MATTTGKKIIGAEDIGPHIEKKRGELSYIEFGEKTGLTRQNLYALRKGLYIPTPRTLAALGLEGCYRVLDDAPMKSDRPKESDKPLTAEQKVRKLEREVRKLKRAAKAKS
jgi:hypothetical protein